MCQDLYFFASASASGPNHFDTDPDPAFHLYEAGTYLSFEDPNHGNNAASGRRSGSGYESETLLAMEYR